MTSSKGPLHVHTVDPLNAEPPLPALGRTFVTPQALFYVRNHGAIPDVQPGSYRLEIGGLVERPRTYTLDELRSRFTAASVAATIQCAGNRRAGLAQVAPVDGQPWDAGAIANGVWDGVRLGDVLRDAGCSESAEHHVEFVSPDESEHEGRRFPYRVSIPLHKALAPEVLLAFTLNGEALSAEHGAPLRAIVPGYAGVRSAKWLSAVRVLDRPSDGYMQQHEYRIFPPESDAEHADWRHATTITTLPLNAAICEPAAGTDVPTGRCAVRGYAIAAGGARVARVEVSPDGGRSWLEAALEQPRDTPWSWTLWRITLDLPAGHRELVVRAWDEAGQTQPAGAADVWNFKGYLNASWHRVVVHAVAPS